MRRLIVSLVLLLLSSISQVGAIVTIDSYAFSNGNSAVALNRSYENCAGGNCEVGQTFLVTIASAISSVSFNMSKILTPNINIYAVVYQITGISGVDATPTGTALAISQGIDSSTLSTTYQQVDFSFAYPNQITLSASTNYAIGVRSSGGEADVTSYINVALDNSSPTHDGNRWSRTSSAYTAFDTQDITFILTGTGGIVSGGDGGSPTGEPSTDQPSPLPVVGGSTAILVIAGLGAYYFFGRGRRGRIG